MTAYRKKLIEGALRLAAINNESIREKFRHGHPSTLPLWWACRPLAASCINRIVGGGLLVERA